ncbi:MAG: energy transducer TonB [Paludibacter sp.]|jgi:TonB family protein|nr:energy transducer TonB [Paludibacter sp.]
MKRIHLTQIYLAKATKIALFVFAFSFINPSLSLAQEQHDSTKLKLSEIDGTSDTFDGIHAKFKGGDRNKFQKWLSGQLSYPIEALKNKEYGTVIIGFVVDKDGKVKKVTLISGISLALNAEAIRVVSKSPKWTPAYKNGVPVAIIYTIPIHFKIPYGFEDIQNQNDQWNNSKNQNNRYNPRY